MFWTLLLLAIGFALLIFGADFFVKGASSLARRFRVSEMVIGLTIIAFGTSAPELVVNLIATFQGHSNVVLGNIIGSNNFNLLIILSITTLIFPVSIRRSIVLKEVPFSLVAAIVLLVLANDNLLFDASTNTLSRLDGLIMLVFFILFVVYIIYNIREKDVEDATPDSNYSLGITVLCLLGGLAGLVFGGRLIVDNAVKLAQQFGISDRMIGLTIVAAGTSLPELATTAVAAFRKKSDLALGNIIGSNIMNFFLVLPICLVISPTAYSIPFNIDLTLLIMGTIALILFTYTGKRARIDRWEAIVFLTMYGLYAYFFM